VFGLKSRTEKPSERESFDWYLQQYAQWSTGGNTYVQPFNTTMPGQKSVPIAQTFSGYLEGGYAGNGVVFALASVRMRVFSEARFQYQRMRGGRPGDLWGDASLSLLETPWPGGTTGDLLSAMLLHADFAGNAFVVRSGDRFVMLRPDWVQILLAHTTYDDGIQAGSIGYITAGYAYYHGGIGHQSDPVVFMPNEVAHFMPQPDPRMPYNVGMSWLSPVIREIQADQAATTHKLKFFENAATPNLAVSLPKEVTPQQFNDFVEAMDGKHKGAANAYKTLYTGGGADVTVIGANMQQLDFGNTQGKGETRLAAAAGVPAVVAGISEGLAGSSLNAGNFGQARRQFADTTLSNLWRNAAGSLENIVQVPSGSRLWYDTRDIPFLREDQKDEAEIQATQAAAVRQLVDAGFEPDSIVGAIKNNDMKLLVHTGLFSVQLQPPGTQTPAVEPQKALPPAREEPIFNIAVDARTTIERGAIAINEGDTNVGLQGDELRDAFEQMQLDVRVESPNVNVTVPDFPAFPELPAPIINVAPAEQKPMRRTAVRDSDGRILETIDRVIDE
jgi:phage portal protein BeeE